MARADPPGLAVTRAPRGFGGRVSVLRFALVIAATALGTAVGLEAYLRLTAPSLVQAPSREAASGAGSERGAFKVKRQVLARKDVSIRINGHGFRGPDVAVPKPEGEVRVLVLGDSIAFGAALAEEDLYATRLQAALAEAVPGRTVAVVNAGVNNVGLQEELDLLEQRGLAVAPDVVLLAFYLNDSRPPWGFPRELAGRGWLRRRSVLADTLYTSVAFRRWLRSGGAETLGWVDAKDRLPWRSDHGAFLELVASARHDWGAAWWPPSWELVGAQLDWLATMKRQHGFHVAMAVFPVSFQVEARFLDDEPQRRFLREAAARGFGGVDLLAVLRGAGRQDLFFDHCHLRPDGHRIVAAALAADLAPRLGSWSLGDAPHARGSDKSILRTP